MINMDKILEVIADQYGEDAELKIMTDGVCGIETDEFGLTVVHRDFYCLEDLESWAKEI